MRGPEKTYLTNKFECKLVLEYLQIFPSFKDQKITLLEIGAASGGFEKWCCDYFTNTDFSIIGVDWEIPPPEVDDRPFYDPRFSFYQFGQLDTEKWWELVGKHSPFDIIIDDASHQTKETKHCFDLLWQFVIPGGYYVIEDFDVGWWTPPNQFEGMVDLVSDIFKKIPQLGIMEMKMIKKENPNRSICFIRKECSPDTYFDMLKSKKS